MRRKQAINQYIFDDQYLDGMAKKQARTQRGRKKRRIFYLFVTFLVLLEFVEHFPEKQRQDVREHFFRLHVLIDDHRMMLIYV